jgi:hypothetical protein
MLATVICVLRAVADLGDALIGDGIAHDNE